MSILGRSDLASTSHVRSELVAEYLLGVRYAREHFLQSSVERVELSFGVSHRAMRKAHTRRTAAGFTRTRLSSRSLWTSFLSVVSFSIVAAGIVAIGGVLLFAGLYLRRHK